MVQAAIGHHFKVRICLSFGPATETNVHNLACMLTLHLCACIHRYHWHNFVCIAPCIVLLLLSCLAKLSGDSLSRDIEGTSHHRMSALPSWPVTQCTALSEVCGVVAEADVPSDVYSLLQALTGDMAVR